MNAIASKWSSGGEKGASKMLRSRSSAENPKEVALSVALYEEALWTNWHKGMQYCLARKSLVAVEFMTSSPTDTDTAKCLESGRRLWRWSS